MQKLFFVKDAKIYIDMFTINIKNIYIPKIM